MRCFVSFSFGLLVLGGKSFEIDWRECLVGSLRSVGWFRSISREAGRNEWILNGWNVVFRTAGADDDGEESVK